MRHVEPVVQDADLPRPEAPAFLQFLFDSIGILPVWICPIRAATAAQAFPLFPLRPGMPYVNFGFWDVIERRVVHPPAHFNRLVERRVAAAGGIKSLYSDSFFDRADFAARYGLAAHAALKSRYDPQDRLLGLYEKCVLRR
jgi:FAD/FMN-containing dehydrogenase